MHTPTFTRFLTLSAALAVAGTTARAGFVTWGAATDIAGDSDVSLAGTPVRAFSLYGPGTTVGGVLFEPMTPGTTVGDFTLGPARENFTGSYPALSPAYERLLITPAFTQLGDSSITLDIAGLEVGGSYLFQWWSSTIQAGSQINDVLTSAGGAALDPNTTNVIGGRGQYQIGTFAATTPTQTFTFAGAGSSIAVASYLNGFQLRQTAPPPVVPEPGTALFGLALLAPALTRRARR